MRAVLLCLIGMMTASTSLAYGQMKLSPKAAPGANEVRYFTSIDGLMDGNADVILKETRQGKTVTAATLDVRYPVAKDTDRKDRFVVNLAVNGQTLTGTTQSLGDKQPVTVKLVRKPTGDNFEFKGQISIGQTVTEVASTDNSDISEKEFQDNQTTDDGITATPKDFTEVSPESVGVEDQARRSAGFPQRVEGTERRGFAEQPCGHLRCAARWRADHQSQRRSGSGRGADREIQIIARRRRGRLDHRRRGDGTHHPVSGRWLARRRPAQSGRTRREPIADVLAGTLSAKSSSSTWNPNTGMLKLVFKRPSQLFPGLDLTETVEVTALVSSDKPGASDRLMLWIGNPAITTADETAGAKLNLADESSGEEEGEQKADDGSVDALAREFKAQRWDLG